MKRAALLAFASLSANDEEIRDKVGEKKGKDKILCLSVFLYNT